MFLFYFPCYLTSFCNEMDGWCCDSLPSLVPYRKKQEEKVALASSYYNILIFYLFTISLVCFSHGWFNFYMLDSPIALDRYFSITSENEEREEDDRPLRDNQVFTHARPESYPPSRYLIPVSSHPAIQPKQHVSSLPK